MAKPKTERPLDYHANRLLQRRATTPDTLCRSVREKLGISQAEFAPLVGVDAKTISRYETGRTPLKIVQNALEKLAKRHGVPLTTPGDPML